MKKLIILLIALFFALPAWAGNSGQSTLPHGAGNNISNLTGSVAKSTTTTIGTMTLPSPTDYNEACQTIAEFQLCSTSGTTATVVVGVSNPEGNATCSAAGVPFSCCTGSGTTNGTGVCNAWPYPMGPYLGIVHSSRNLTLAAGVCQDVTIVRQDSAISDGTNVPGSAPITLPNGTNGSSVPLLALSIHNTGVANALTYSADATMLCSPLVSCLTTTGCSQGTFQ